MPKPRHSHTTLERKIRLIFGLLILLIIVAALFFPWYQTETLVTDQDMLLAQEIARNAWWTIHTRALLPADRKEQMAELDNLAPPSSRPDAKAPRIISLNPDTDHSERQPRDARERRWLEKFAANPDMPNDSDRVQVGDNFFFRYAYPLRARDACVNCHEEINPGIKSGDLMGAIVVSLPTEETREKLKWNRAILIGAAFVIAILSMLAFWAVVRLVIVQPVEHLKRVADRVSEGNLHVRSDIQTGDEFEGLARSINRMLQRLEASREELRRANISLDQKLEELARANVSLFEMNQIKNKFLTTMSHELRTPLNAILGFADILVDHEAVAADPKLARYVHNIQNSGRLLLDIINDLLDLAKIEAGKMEVKLGRVSPLDLCETTLNMVRPMVGAKDLRLELAIDPACPIMTTDANKLQQVLYNLLSNAVKFTPAGTVKLATRPIDSRTVLFQVSDTGPGLSPEQQKVIFDRFSQLDSSYTRQYGGTGLGLSIVKELVDLLGGDVAVQSELGQGATFNVTMPIVTEIKEEKPVEAPITRVEAHSPPREPTEEKAPRPITSEDTFIAHDADVDQLRPEPDEK